MYENIWSDSQSVAIRAADALSEKHSLAVGSQYINIYEQLTFHGVACCILCSCFSYSSMRAAPTTPTITQPNVNARVAMVCMRMCFCLGVCVCVCVCKGANGEAYWYMSYTEPVRHVPVGLPIWVRCHEINSHEINSHEINSHKINSHEINFSRDQFPHDQLQL